MINAYYTQRINKAIDFLEENLSDRITLEKLADVAMFSKFHFHRIFKIVAQDTLNNYVKRLRMEKAGKLLKTEKNETIINIARALGYSSNSNFSRDFNEYYGCSPTEFRQNKSKPIIREISLRSDLNLTFAGIENIKDNFVIYDRISAGYNTELISESYAKLYWYAQENDLVQSIDQCIGVGYDDPDYTPIGKCRYDACISINKALIPDGLPFNTKEIKGGEYATFLFCGEKEKFYDAWDVIFQEWLLSSEYIPDNKPHFEIYLPSEDHDKGIFKAKLCLPVKPIK